MTAEMAQRAVSRTAEGVVMALRVPLLCSDLWFPAAALSGHIGRTAGLTTIVTDCKIFRMKQSRRKNDVSQITESDKL